jgi:hypothetical protein
MRQLCPLPTKLDCQDISHRMNEMLHFLFREQGEAYGRAARGTLDSNSILRCDFFQDHGMI